MPFFESRRGEEILLGMYSNSITTSFENASNDDVCRWINIELPTNKGYQLEYLGKFYELMIRLEDAKKCYELQYECTKESEFLDIIKKLDEKIKETNTVKTIQNSTKSISYDDTKKLVIQNELDTREFILKIFNSNLSQIWKFLPKIKKNIDYKRSEQEEKLTDIIEKSPLDYATFGELVNIVEVCNPQQRSRFNDVCKKCHKKWNQKDKIFQIEKWMSDILPLKNATALMLEIIRGSSVTSFETASEGFFQRSLDKEKVSYLLRFSLPMSLPVFPEVSGGKHRFTVRFFHHYDTSSKPKQTSETIQFQLQICSI